MNWIVEKKKLVIILQIGDWNGKRPMLAVSNASAIVASGALRALPTTVRLSRDIPKVDNHKIKVRT